MEDEADGYDYNDNGDVAREHPRVYDVHWQQRLSDRELSKDTLANNNNRKI